MSSRGTSSTILRCPVCWQRLSPIKQGVICINNHQFDRARKGYINLLQGHKKRSRHPGDDKAMVDARASFLSAGYYAAVSEKLISTIKSLESTGKAPVIVDAGCGEGYYTHRISQALTSSQVIGFDISKPAVQACCRRDKAIQWLVASVNDIPLVDDKADIIISVFSRCDWSEFQRILKLGGYVLVVGPAPDHLRELREVIYEQVRPYPEDKIINNLPNSFSLENTQKIEDEMKLVDSASIMALLSMTPHYWRIRPEQKERLQNLSSLTCHYDMLLRTIKLV